MSRTCKVTPSKLATDMLLINCSTQVISIKGNSWCLLHTHVPCLLHVKQESGANWDKTWPLHTWHPLKTVKDSEPQESMWETWRIASIHNLGCKCECLVKGHTQNLCAPYRLLDKSSLQKWMYCKGTQPKLATDMLLKNCSIPVRSKQGNSWCLALAKWHPQNWQQTCSWLTAQLRS